MTAQQIIRVLVADDDVRVVEVLCEVLASETDLTVVKTASTIDATLEACAELHPDVVVVDAGMIGADAPQTTRQLLDANPSVKVIALSAQMDPPQMAAMFQAGAVGYMIKGQTRPSLDEAIRRVASGEAIIPREVIAAIAEAPSPTASRDGTVAHTPRWTSLVAALEAERKRIAGDIHDDPLQIMAVASMRLGLLRDRLDDENLQAIVDQTRNSVQAAVGRLRNVLFELRPHALEIEGLAAAVRVYLEETMPASGIAFGFTDSLGAEPAEAVQAVVYRIAQEALLNVRKHSGATRVDVRLGQRDKGITLQIRDNGTGFDVKAPAVPGHLGMATMRDRAELAGGWLTLASIHGRGTTVEAWVPSAPEA